MIDVLNTRVLRQGRDDAGKTVLHYAAAAGHLEMCRYLVESFPEFAIDFVDCESELVIDVNRSR